MNAQAETTNPGDTGSAKRAALFVNGASRRGKQSFESAQAHLRTAGFDLTNSVCVKKNGELERLVRAEIALKTPLIVVGGGDGTLNSIIGTFVGSDSTLGVLPFGTGNAFSRELGMPSNIEGAAQMIAAGRTANVDLGTLDGKPFVNVATVGLTTLIARELEAIDKKVWGLLSYFAAISRSLHKARCFKVAIITGEGETVVDTLQLVIGSGRFHAGPFPLSPDASIVDGKLRLYALASKNRWDLIKLALKLPSGRQGELAEVVSLTTDGGRIETSPTQRVTIDGEIKSKTPFEFGILPSAVRVIVSEDFDQRERMH